MSPLTPSNLTTAGPNYSYIPKAQEKDLKIVFTNMIEVLNSVKIQRNFEKK